MPPHRPTLHLLIVEDDEDDYLLTADLLRESELFDCRLDWVSTPQQAREAMADQIHDICLMDYRLGAEVGTHILHEAESLGFSAPIIMLTGQQDTGVAVEAAQAGAADYLVKDQLDTEQLQRAIRYALSRREIEAERMERMQAEAKNHSKTEFLATLSHEIRTPLSAILGYTELLLHHSQDDYTRNSLSIIDRNGKHLLSLLNDTLDLSRIEAGKLELEEEEVALWPFLQDLHALKLAAAREKNIDLQLQAQGPLPTTIRSDATRLRQILLNLLGNAIKFTQQGRVTLTVSLESGKQGYQLLCQVTDTGPGIPEDHLESIFQAFTQLPGQPGARSGSGLGLAISRRLATCLGGSLEASSQLGQGSCFSLRIDPGPLHASSLTDITQKQEESPPPLPILPATAGRVLVVDDAPDVRNLVREMLQRLGLSSLQASDGQEALAVVARERPALILMDLNMPRLDGCQTLTRLRQSGLTLPVVALTAANLRGERESCLAAGFDDFLSKPVSLHGLADCLVRLLPKQPTETAADRPHVPPTPAPASRILLVEDDPDANQATCLLLEMLGFQVSGAHDCQQARRLAATSPPDIILTDRNLPDGDGLALACELKQDHPARQVFLVTGQEQGDLSLPPAINGYLVKPLDLTTLKQLLQV